MSDKKTKTSIAVDVQKWRDFGAELRRRGIDYSDGLEMLIDWFLEHGLSPKDFGLTDEGATFAKRKNVRYHKLLEVILESNSPGAREAIIKNLRVFAFSTTVAGPKTDEQLDKDLDLLIDGLKDDVEKEPPPPKPRRKVKFI